MENKILLYKVVSKAISTEGIELWVCSSIVAQDKILLGNILHNDLRYINNPRNYTRKSRKHYE